MIILPRRIRSPLPLLLAVLLLAACSAKNSGTPPPEPEIPPHLADVLEQSALAVERLAAKPENAALAELLPNARAVMVFPEVTGAGIVFQGGSGRGVLTARGGVDGGFGPPVFYKLTWLGAGVQAGFSKTSLLYLVMDDDTLDGLVENSMDLGADVRQVSGEEMARDQVALSEALGGVVLFADATGYELGAQVKTQLVTASRSGVRQSYGDNATMRGVALGHGAAVPGSARPLLRALRAASE